MNEAEQIPDLTEAADHFELEEGETVNQKYIEFLELLRYGRNRLDELADGLGINGVEAEQFVRAAEQHGDVVREGYMGMALYTIHLTDQGGEKVSDLTATQQVLSEYDMTERDWAVLEIIESHGPCTAQTLLEEYPKEIAPMKLIPSVNHLVRVGYCDESGLWRRGLSLTDDGADVIAAVRESL